MSTKSSSSSLVEELRQVCQNEGKRITLQRLAIAAYLEGNLEHPTAEHIYLALRAYHPQLSLTTVYNTLHLMKKVGLIREISIPTSGSTIGGKLRQHYDPDPTCHYHFLCRSCGVIFDLKSGSTADTKDSIEFKKILPVLQRSVLAQDFTAEMVHLNIVGLCSKCRHADKY